MATNRGRPRSTGKAVFKNTLDKYSSTEKETPAREKVMEAVVEEIEKMERGFEAMIEEIKYIYIGKASGGAEERNERGKGKKGKRDRQRERRVGMGKERIIG